ncbi:metallophosphoesterase family protein [Deinococcus aquiradiocola]|uniref:Metallophosphoesterase n=1 Tax=Deinococcus aquiradiocola TaxID=393059 RepID=A0A917PG47_9DEIO|nr:metallophosphoesterase family protein [Deinococcus aquiradiocola]GGJ76202.1 metallophosphoesterase [Deinococcus aquiradiocola]
MKVAVFGDVHGNRFALEAVAADIGRHRPDVWVNLGDQVFGGADPAGAFRLQQDLRATYGVHEVRGNTDERLGQPLTDATEKCVTLEWLHALLPPGAGAHVAGLPTTLTVAGGEVLAAHGTPHSAWTALLLDGKAWADDALVLDRLGDTGRAKVVVVGHSHREHVRQVGAVSVVNVGAVSRQRDGSPLARWTLLEGEGDVWNVTLRRVQYDVQGAAAWAETHAPGGTREAAQLRTGRKER